MGPIFANVVLADEVNRAPPRTQSSLLEAMSEGQVSIDDRTYKLDQPFFVIATQNPQEHFGTYPLPESQMDRFLLRTPMGYPRLEDERRVLLLGTEDVLETLRPCIELGALLALQQRVTAVRVDPALVDYLLTVVHESRGAAQLSLGISPRGARAWCRAAQAAALLAGRDFVTPDDLKGLAQAALVHRLVAAGQQDNPSGSRREAELFLQQVLERTPVPR
jgi:MoxR-like ATPase